MDSVCRSMSSSRKLRDHLSGGVHHSGRQRATQTRCAQIRRRVLSGIAELEREPRPHGVRKLSGYDNAWRVRIGDYRVLYEVIDDQVLVTVVRVAHRRDVYEI